MGTIPAKRIKSPGVRFSDEELGPKYSTISDASSRNHHLGDSSQNSGALSPDLIAKLQPAEKRFHINEQRIELLSLIQKVVAERWAHEKDHVELQTALDDTKRKLKWKIEQHEAVMKSKLLKVREKNKNLEAERNLVVKELDHLQKHLEREQKHHQKHMNLHKETNVSQQEHCTKAPSTNCDFASTVFKNVAREGPSKKNDIKLHAARLMNDVATLKRRTFNMEMKLSYETKQKKLLDEEIKNLRKNISNVRTNIAAIRLPWRQQYTPLRAI